MQIQTQAHGLSMVQTIRKVIRSEGVSSLWKGCSPALIRQVGYTGICMTLFEPIKSLVSKDKTSNNFMQKFLSAGVSGAIGITLFNPIEVIKIRQQAHASGHHYSSISNGLRTIVKTEGFRGLWRGIMPNIQRAFIVNAAELGSYDNAKHQFVKRGITRENSPTTHLLSSLVAGFFGAAASNPVDVMKTRLMKQETGLINNSIVAMWQCGRTIYKVEGPSAFYKGFVPNWLRKGPWCIIFFLSYEQIMKRL